MKNNLLSKAKSIHEDIRSWRREIHKYPELSFTEEKTSQLVQKVLTDLDIEFKSNVAKTGVVGLIKGKGGKTVGLRADMDALPIFEENETNFNSSRNGIMHACGHDAHTAMLLGAARILKEMATKGELAGDVRLLFQPSEEDWDDEGKSGGKRMVEEGALDGLDVVFGLHVDPEHDIGTVSTRSGPMLAAVDTFEIVIKGKGGHAASPHLTKDVIPQTALVINAIQQIVSRRLDPIESGVVSITTINGGNATNVIDEKITLTGTLRSLTQETRELLRQELCNACEVVKAMGGDYEISFEYGYPVTNNDPETTKIAITAVEKILGKENVQEADITLGAEDFSYMAQAVPGNFLFLGTHNPSWDKHYYVHTPTFRIDEDALPIGSASLCAAAIEYFDS